MAGVFYETLARELAHDIASGRYPVGSQLPSEAQLCAANGLSRGTVREALRQIEDAGMIVRRQGAPTLVIAAHPMEEYRPVVSSTDDIYALMHSTRLRRPALSAVVANAAMSRALGVRRGSKWHRIEGVREVRGRSGPPMCWSEYYLKDGYADLERFQRGDLSPREAAQYAVEQTISADKLDPEIARRLESTNDVALVVTSHRRDLKGRLVSIAVHTHPADRYRLRTTVERSQHEL